MYLNAVKVAKEWGWSPAAILLEYEEPHKVTRHDYALAMAVNILDNEKCPKCGVASWWAFSTDNTIEFEVHEQTCHSCAHKEQHEAKLAREKVKPKAGTTMFVKAKAIEDYELPTRRDFGERLKAEADAKAELEQ